jgi:uncharacterized membrane-anchored protein YjiN (DUF445 family)
MATKLTEIKSNVNLVDIVHKGAKIMADEQTKPEGTIDVSALTEDQVMELFEKNQAAKAYLQRTTDQAVTKGIQTFEQKTLPERVKAELDKANPKETDQQREMREMKETLSQLVAEKKKAELTTLAVKRLRNEQLPDEFLDFISYTDEDSVNSQLDKLKKVFTDKLNSAVEAEQTKRTGRTPAPNPSDIKNPLGYNPFDRATWNLTEQIKLDKENAALAAHLEKIAKK